MLEQYVHILIPRDAHFAPEPHQTASFVDNIFAFDAAPQESKLIVMKASGRVRFFADPLTGEKKSFPAYDRAVLSGTGTLAAAIDSLPEYYVALEGLGPPPVPPFPLYSNGDHFSSSYGLAFRCCLKKEPVSMSEFGVDAKVGFGAPVMPITSTHRFIILKTGGYSLNPE